MAAPLLKKIQTIGAKTEATPGTPIALTDADGALNAMEIECQANIPVAEREGQGGFDRLQGVAGPRSGTLSFRTDIEWDGTGLPFWASVLLPACGWVGGIPDANTFTPRSEGFAQGNVKSLTMARFIDGVYKQLAGAVGNFRFVFPAGEVAYIEWTFTGVWHPVTDVPIITPTYPRQFVSRYADATTQYQGKDLCMAEVAIDGGNNVIMRECAGDISGYESALITDRRPFIEGDPEAELVANRDDWGNWINNVEDEFLLGVKSDGSSSITLSAPQAQIDNVQEGDRDLLEINNITWMCNKNQSVQDQCLRIIFTPNAP